MGTWESDQTVRPAEARQGPGKQAREEAGKLRADGQGGNE